MILSNRELIVIEFANQYGLTHDQVYDGMYELGLNNRHDLANALQENKTEIVKNKRHFAV